MSINVTPIPRLIDLAAPAFTLGTSNAAGSAPTAVSSDSTLLTFDGTDPAAVAASAAVGSATVAARRDHVHAGTTGAGTVVDEAITRFDGTSGASLQGYSSLSPTISNAGIISLTSGALKFPATAINSTDPNTLDDYETGTFSPGIADDNLDPSGEGQTYHVQVGRYTKVGNRVLYSANVRINSLGTLTTSQQVRITGLPFTSNNTSSNEAGGVCTGGSSVAYPAAVTPFGRILWNEAYIRMYLWDSTSGPTGLTVAELSAGGELYVTGQYMT